MSTGSITCSERFLLFVTQCSVKPISLLLGRLKTVNAAVGVVNWKMWHLRIFSLCFFSLEVFSRLVAIRKQFDAETVCSLPEFLCYLQYFR